MSVVADVTHYTIEEALVELEERTGSPVVVKIEAQPWATYSLGEPCLRCGSCVRYFCDPLWSGMTEPSCVVCVPEVDDG